MGVIPPKGKPYTDHVIPIVSPDGLLYAQVDVKGAAESVPQKPEQPSSSVQYSTIDICKTKALSDLREQMQRNMILVGESSSEDDDFVDLSSRS